MYLHHQGVVDTLVRQFTEDFAYLAHDLRIAVPEVASRWADRYAKATDLHGMTRCIGVRQTLFSIFDAYQDKCFPVLSVRPGPALSVVLTAPGGTDIRVRHWPSDNLGHRVRVISTPPPGQAEAVAQGQQMTLDDDYAEPVFPTVASSDATWGLYVLWRGDTDEVMLASASLAAVLNIDDPSQVRILAEAPLPAPKRRPADPQAQSPHDTLEPSDDFDEFDHGSSEAAGITPA